MKSGAPNARSGWKGKNEKPGRPGLFKYCFFSDYSGLMFVAAGPLAPCVTSNETFCASFSDL